MAEQLSFPGFGEPPRQASAADKPKPAAKGGRPKYALKFSIFPAPADALEIVRLTGDVLQAQGLTGKPLRSHRLHVTVHNLGEYEEVPQDLVAAAMKAGDALAFEAFEVGFDCAMSFPRSGTYVLSGHEGTRQLTAFYEELGESLRSQGLRVTRSFTPSMALVYDKHFVAEHSIVPVRWKARGFVLIRSHIGTGKYDLLGSWPVQL
ncbi:MAG: 2'-5' RNA ligase family protein [Pseudomonadota bacterium]